MADNIALKVILEGVKEGKNSIQELEIAIREATEALKIFRGTPEERKELEESLKAANKELTNFKSNIKGVGFSKQTQDLLNFGSLIVSTFSAAQTTLSLLGKDTEDVAKAQAKAQKLLTLAYTSAEIAKNADTIATIGNTAAKIANTLATQGLTAATKLLFNTIKANPLGFFLQLLTAVISALVIFSDETDDATAAQDRLNAKFRETNSENQLAIDLARIRGEDAVSIAKRELDAANEVLNQKRFIALNDKNNAEAQQEYADAKREATKAQARFDKEVADAKQDQLDKEKKKQEELDAIRKKNEEERQRRLTEIAQLQTDILENLNKEIGTEFPEPESVKRLEKYVEYLEDLSNILSARDFQTSLAFDIQFEEILGQGDVLTRLVKNFREQFATAASGFGEDITEVRKKFLDEAGKLVQEGLVSPEAFKSVLELVDAYELLATKGIDIPQYITKQGQESFLRYARAIKINSGEITKTLDENGQIVAARTKISFSDAEANYKRLTETLLSDFTEYILATDNEIRKITDPAEREKLARERAQARLDIITKQTDEILKQEQRVFDYIDKENKLNEEKEKLRNSSRLGYVAQNIDKIIAEYQNLYDFETDQAEIAFDEMIRGLVDFTKLTDEELQQLSLLYQMFYMKLNDLREDDSNKAAENLKKFQKNIADIQTALSSVAQFVSDSFNFQLELLEKRYQRVLDTIVGDTDAANQKRLEAEKAYNEERKRLEKQAAKTSLRISLVQAIANTAEAITKSFTAGPIIGQIAAGVVALASGAQIALIQNQIAAIDSYRKGGFIKGQGGFLVNGPSHEYGGVKFQNGGIELEGNEAVINRVSAVRYGSLLNQINMAGGGNALVNNFDDSRIVEAIAKQRMEPIRAYVVESDITSKQEVRRRLELLAQV